MIPPLASFVKHAAAAPVARPARRAGLLGVSLLSLATAAAAQTAQTYSLELSTERQQLSNNSPDWQEHTLRLQRSFGQRQLGEFSLVQTERFGKPDDQYNALYAHPLSPQWGLALEASVSPTHRVLPQHSVGGMLQYEFAPTWLVHGGVKSTHYNNTVVQQGTVMLEHYVASFSWALAWKPVRALGSTPSSAELRGSYFYGERSVVSLSLADGQEATEVAANDIRLADVRSAALNGRHWLNRDWALTYVVSSTRQGNFYTRNGLRIGVQYSF